MPWSASAYGRVCCCTRIRALPTRTPTTSTPSSQLQGGGGRRRARQRQRPCDQRECKHTVARGTAVRQPAQQTARLRVESPQDARCRAAELETPCDGPQKVRRLRHARCRGRRRGGGSGRRAVVSRIFHSTRGHIGKLLALSPHARSRTSEVFEAQVSLSPLELRQFLDGIPLLLPCMQFRRHPDGVEILERREIQIPTRGLDARTPLTMQSKRERKRSSEKTRERKRSVEKKYYCRGSDIRPP
jgi:hypothetical protein